MRKRSQGGRWSQRTPSTRSEIEQGKRTICPISPSMSSLGMRWLVTSRGVTSALMHTFFGYSNANPLRCWRYIGLSCTRNALRIKQQRRDKQRESDQNAQAIKDLEQELRWCRQERLGVFVQRTPSRGRIQVAKLPHEKIGYSDNSVAGIVSLVHSSMEPQPLSLEVTPASSLRVAPPDITETACTLSQPNSTNMSMGPSPRRENQRSTSTAEPCPKDMELGRFSFDTFPVENLLTARAHSAVSLVHSNPFNDRETIGSPGNPGISPLINNPEQQVQEVDIQREIDRARDDLVNFTAYPSGTGNLLAIGSEDKPSAPMERTGFTRTPRTVST